MGQHEPLRAGALRVLARLLGRQVAADAVALGTRQRRLEDQQVGLGGERDDLLVRAAVGAEDAARPAAERRDLDRERRDVVRHEREAQLQPAELDDVVVRVLLCRERARRRAHRCPTDR